MIGLSVWQTNGLPRRRLGSNDLIVNDILEEAGNAAQLSLCFHLQLNMGLQSELFSNFLTKHKGLAILIVCFRIVVI